jgi:SAM-dependent methyltransferase
MHERRERPAVGAQTVRVSYMFPRHPAEIDRLDVQHYALREALGGNYLAPVVRPARVLDVGSGTGQWAYDICDELPEALVAGVDVEPSKRGHPAGYRFVRGNVLQGLPFAGGAFDFVHQRFMAASGIPVAAWAGLVADLARITRPGGHLELVEVRPWVEPAGPATARLFEMARSVGRLYRLDMDGAALRSLDRSLRDVGLVEVGRRQLDLPVGEWGGRIGSLLATNARALHARLTGAFRSRLGVPEEESHALLEAMHGEWDHHRSRWRFVVAWGRRPR